MSIRRRLVLLVIALLALSTAFVTRQLLNSFHRGYADVVESLMFDFGTALASQVELEGGTGVAKGKLEALFKTYRARTAGNPQSAGGGFEIYITDEKGIVVFSSANPEEEGRDYSRWRDVYLTLRDSYGARATRVDPRDPSTSVYFVAAPIRKDGKISGVVSVIKPKRSIEPFLARAFQQVLPYAGLGLVLVAIFAALVMSWVTRPIHRLRDYALRISEGNPAPLPTVAPKELRELLDAFEKMRITLEGRREVESFVQGLVHELKSPLTAIRGSAELALEPIDPARRQRFLRSILDENRRLQRLLDELLRIARLGGRTGLAESRRISIENTVERVRSAFEALAESRRIRIEVGIEEDARIEGDPELVESALRCLVLNAFDFAPEGSAVTIRAKALGEKLKLSVRDEGPGVPEFAREKIFDRFFSLERPSGAGKSTGLGLNFVREVMKLHHGTVELVPTPSGAEFSLEFPRANA